MDVTISGDVVVWVAAAVAGSQDGMVRRRDDRANIEEEQ